MFLINCKKLRFGLQSGLYPHPVERPWLDDEGKPTDDGDNSHRPSPAWFHSRVDLAVRTAFDNDLIADLILADPDSLESRTTLNAKNNAGDATPYLHYIAARYGSYPNVWLCLCNEYDIKLPKYTQAEIAKFGVTIRNYLAYPTPLSVHDGSSLGWSEQFDDLPRWADHQIVQKKLTSLGPAADVNARVWQGTNGDPKRKLTPSETAALNPRNQPTINDELSYQGAGDMHSELDTIESHLGAFLGGGYASTGEKYGQKLGQYFWGKFDATKHTASDNLAWLRNLIDREINFWQLAPMSCDEIFENIAPGFRAMGWKNREYVLGTNTARKGLVAILPAGAWTVVRHDVVLQDSRVLAIDQQGRYSFDAPESRAVLFHFKRK